MDIDLMKAICSTFVFIENSLFLLLIAVFKKCRIFANA